ncbi:probable protein phosphatase 2C 51 [Chenopodium quinoa]|uniref:probable protein phosphatase 2C 51 n=1 Tax=Chenopodium quinoa TaxID=63459 RepID=UPI000B781B89|nr:probable protein phosphatase 2C 51 [Chenopodium quinoa]
MENFKIECILVGVLFNIIVGCHGRSHSCMRLYNEGGAPAVLQSSECSFEYVHPKNPNHTTKCQCSSLKGRRKYQEDRVFCDLDMQIDLLGNLGQENVKIGVAAVFDGHGGKEASELAVQLLPYYIQLHISFLSQKEMELFEDGHHMAFPLDTEFNSLETRLRRRMNESKTMEIIQEAVLLAVHNIDLTFSEVALRKHLLSGTTATIAILVDNELLIANVGDSKAFLCLEMIQTCDVTNNKSTSMTSFQVIELTADHHPDRDDEMARVTAAGGFVSLLGVPRVNGILAVSRSIGDVYLKRYGVIAEPEVKWYHLDASAVFLVVASDGIFEGLNTQEVCRLLHEAYSQDENQNYSRSSNCQSSSWAECIVNKAYEKGSTDYLSVVLIPLNNVIT